MMILHLSFSMLLASVVLVLLATTDDVQAAPVKRGGIVTIPLRSLHNKVRDSEVHPHIVRVILPVADA